MATIYQQNGRYRCQIRLSGHPAQSRNFASKRAAERWGVKIEKQLKTGNYSPRKLSQLTLGDAIDAYITSPKGELLTKHDLNLLEWWRRTLGNLQLQKLKRAHFFEARDRLTGANGERLAIATVNKRMALIAAVLTRALDRDWIQHHPARIRRLTEKNQRERILDEEERHSLLDACKRSDEPALYPFVVSAMISGARAGELKNLRMKDTNLMIGTALLSKTKSGRKRSIPLRGEALAAILSYHACANTSGRVYLFSNRNKNSAFDYRRSWDKARREASLLDVHFHDLRHLAASELAMSGASAREIQFLLGHASAQMTARYSHLLNNHHVPLGDRLNERFFPSR